MGLKSHIAEQDTQIASLRETVLNLTHENALLKRRVYGNKTERAHTSELQLALGDLLDDEKMLQKQLDAAVVQARGSAGDDSATPPADDGKVKAKPKGRRDLSTSTLPRFLLEICDEEMEKSCKRIGFDGSKSSKASPVSDRQPPHLNTTLGRATLPGRATRAKCWFT